MDYEKLIQGVLEDYKISPVEMLESWDASSEYAYLRSLKDSYVRTVRDVDSLFKGDRSDRNILEIGSFLGAVSISLKTLGFNVSATDIPEFHDSSSLRSHYEKNGIPFTGLNLRGAKLPCESDSMDAVIMCEVLEHLNFNPLPTLVEINRVLKTDGYLYIGMPNQSCIRNRVKMFFGRSIHDPIEYFFQQLDRRYNMVVGLHWREYTLEETVELVEKMGFAAIERKYFYNRGLTRPYSPMAMLMKVVYAYSPFMPYQVVTCKKVSVPSYEFWMTGANS